MPFKPNYRMQRADRNRAKDLKKQEKLARRAEASEKRKAEREQQPKADEPESA